jgi:hypothetical protein
VARRKKSAFAPGMIAAAGLVFVGLVAVWWFSTGNADPHRTVPGLDVGDYLEDSNTLRGNTYKIVGTVAESLAWSPDAGRLIAVRTDEGVVPVLVTADFNGMNIQKEQKLVFLVEVDEKGILRTRKVEKS